MLDAKAVETIRQAELAAVLKKLKAGKSLTASDRKLLESQQAPAPEPKETLYSVNALAKLTGKDRRTLDKVLVKVKPAGVVKGKPVYRREDVDVALCPGLADGESYTELRAEQIRQQTRESRERADILAMEKKQKAGELVLMSEVQDLYTQALLPVRQALLSMPAELCTLVNPTDPQFARDQAQRWVDGRMPAIREKLPKPKTAKGE